VIGFLPVPRAAHAAGGVKSLRQTSEQTRQMTRSEPLHPLIFKPLYRHYLWGGRRLVEVFGRRSSDESPLAESWDLVDRDEAQSIVAHGPLEGRSLRELCGTRPLELFGAAACPPTAARRFPLLVKLLDAERDLSVQVHPDDQAAAQLAPPDRGKSEAWYVIGAQPGSLVHLGLREGTDAASLRESLASGNVVDLLATRPSRAGDCYYIPAGTVHALGAGNLVAEIQQSSDVTYRLHDWNRLGPDNRPRPLHVEEGLAAVGSFEPVRPAERRATADPDAARLVDCVHFSLDEVRPRGRWTAGCGATAEIVICVAGGFTLERRWSLPPIPSGGTVLLPAAIGGQTIDCAPGTTLLRVSLPCL
jgi:mannose-6-phosphate isomerase